MRLTLQAQKSLSVAAKSFASVLVLAFAATFAYAKDYKTIVVFGDSLSDTGNVAHLSEEQPPFVRIPGPIVNYTDGRVTDGSDTIPRARNYFGVWVEQFAATLPSQPEVRDSLDGGTNYAYAFATTANGTSPLTLGPVTVQIDDIGQQITDYLATHPKIDSSTLFIIWGGANDLLSTSSLQDVINAAVRQTLNIQRLVNAGATQFMVANLPPLGLVPRLNGSPATSVPANAASALYNSLLATGVQVLRDFYLFRNLKIYELNTFNLFRAIVASPSSFTLSNITSPSQGQALANPDTYLFWDDLHPTTRGHNILADAASILITQPCSARGGRACVFPRN